MCAEYTLDFDWLQSEVFLTIVLIVNGLQLSTFYDDVDEYANLKTHPLFKKLSSE